MKELFLRLVYINLINVLASKKKCIEIMSFFSVQFSIHVIVHRVRTEEHVTEYRVKVTIVIVNPVTAVTDVN